VISLEEARSIIANHVTSLPPEAVDLSSARGRVLRQKILADGYYPSADRSMMDGYAIAADDRSERFRVVGEIAPGDTPAVALARGECVRIFTGGILPAGASQVIMQEETRREGEWMIPVQRSEKRFVRPRGAEAAPGQLLLDEGTVLGAPELAILAQVGAIQPVISPFVRVTHIATGGELIDPGDVPSGGKIRDTNSALISALVSEAGGVVHAHTRTGDDLSAITAFASTATSDLLLISGGASVGDHDFGARALRELGYTIHFDRVNLRPGKPLTFGTRGTNAAFVLPGNPVSHFVCFHVAVRLALDAFQGKRWRLNFMQCTLAGSDVIQSDPRDTFWPAKAGVSDVGICAVKPLRWSSSGDTFSLAGCNALIHVKSTLSPGEPAPTLLLSAPTPD
jgi:molybdopterin molybdotransferase